MIKNLFSGLPVAASFTLGAIEDKVAEAAGKLKNTFGGYGPLSKIAAQAPTSTEAAADAATAAAAIKSETPGLTDEEVTARIIEAGQNPYANELDYEKANADIIAQIQGQVEAEKMRELNNRRDVDDSYKVKLIEKGVDASDLRYQVIFEIMPDVVESRTVEYEQVQPPQFPGAFQKYKGTSPTQWTINATLTCRTTAEATNNLRILNLLRGWTMPFFGVKTQRTWKNKLGAPPPVLEFSGWKKQMVGPVPVVITSLNWNFPQDVDYIPASAFELDYVNGRRELKLNEKEYVPFPSVIKFAIQLVESFSTDQFNGFDLAEFRAGRMVEAFTPLPRRMGTVTPGTTSSPASSYSDARNGTWEPPPEAQRINPTILDANDARARAAQAVRSSAPISQVDRAGYNPGPGDDGVTGEKLRDFTNNGQFPGA